MKFKNLLDMHIHSDNSPDGENKTTLLCEYAVRQSLRAIAITDHCECNAFYQDKYNITAIQSMLEINKAQAAFTGRLVVAVGVELGQPLQDIDAAEKVLKMGHDFIIGSVHNLDGVPDFYYLDYSLPENDPNLLLDRYLDELISMAEWGGFDTLAHMTYPIRYMPKTYDLSLFGDKIDRLLKILVDSGKALEINTSGLRNKLSECIPSLNIVRRFRELGGEYITIGSDAHRAQDVGANIEDGMQLALDAGFEYITLYQKRTPIKIEIK